MNIEKALAKGYLELSDEEADKVLNELFEMEDPNNRFDAGLGLLLTFIPEDKAGAVLDLASIVSDTYEELEESGEADHDHDHDHDHNHDHPHPHDHKR